jgi:hypothetical protein
VISSSIKCKRRTLDIHEDSRCYRCPHTNVTSVTVIGSVNNVIVFRLVCESRMGCVNLDGDVDPRSFVTRLVHVFDMMRVMS